MILLRRLSQPSYTGKPRGDQTQEEIMWDYSAQGSGVMETEINRSGLKRLKYIMISEKEGLTRLELLLKFIFSLIILSILYFILFARRDSSFLFFEFSSSVRGWILLISMISILWILEYLGKKAKRNKGEP